MICQNNFQCLDVASGWREERGEVVDDFTVVKPPVTATHKFEIWVTGLLDESHYKLLVNNHIVRDRFRLVKHETKEYLHGVLVAGERLTLEVDGSVKYRLKWIMKGY